MIFKKGGGKFILKKFFAKNVFYIKILNNFKKKFNI